MARIFYSISIFAAVALCLPPCHGFGAVHPTVLEPSKATTSVMTTTTFSSTTRTTRTRMYLAKATKNKKKNTSKSKTGGSTVGLKGFGSPVLSSSSASSPGHESVVELDRSKDARRFYEYLETYKAGDNLNRCALGSFPMPGDEKLKLRGIVALKPIKKGDAIVRIPYELAVNLGQEGADPTIPAVALLRDYCKTLSMTDGNDSDDESARHHPRASYYRMLPPFLSDDCLGSTDFFSDHALQELQSPLIMEETLKRRDLVKTRFQSDVASNDAFPSWIDGTPVTEQHLLWAVWLITSRVLTVQGDGAEGKSYRLLIPFLDMCNHDRLSPHILTGRAVPGGELKVVAGGPVKEGEAVNIVYGGGNAGNNRFLQDYGFLDASGKDDGSGPAAYVMVAQDLLGRRRVMEGVGANRFLSEPDRKRSLEALQATTISHDAQLLNEEETDPRLVAAYSYRLGVKRALAKLGAFQET